MKSAFDYQGVRLGTSIIMGLLLGFVVSLGATMLHSPQAVAAQMSLAGPVAGAVSGFMSGRGDIEKVIFGLIAGTSAILGWYMYRGMIL